MKQYLVAALLLVVSTQAFAYQRSGVSTSTTSYAETIDRDSTALFRLEPHWLVFSEAAADLQFKIADNFTLGPTIAYMGNGDGVFYGNNIKRSYVFFDERTNRQSFGARGAYYMNGVERSGMVFGLYGKYMHNEVTLKGRSLFSGIEEKGTFNETTAGFSVGYQWHVTRVLVFNAGGGLAGYFHPSKVTVRNSSGSTDIKLDDNVVGYNLDAGIGFNF